MLRISGQCIASVKGSATRTWIFLEKEMEENMEAEVNTSLRELIYVSSYTKDWLLTQ